MKTVLAPGFAYSVDGAQVVAGSSEEDSILTVRVFGLIAAHDALAGFWDEGMIERWILHCALHSEDRKLGERAFLCLYPDYAFVIDACPIDVYLPSYCSLGGPSFFPKGRCRRCNGLLSQENRYSWFSDGICVICGHNNIY